LIVVQSIDDLFRVFDTVYWSQRNDVLARLHAAQKIPVFYVAFVVREQVAGFCKSGNEVSGYKNKIICSSAGEMLAIQRGLYPKKLVIYLFIILPRFQSSGT